MDEPTDQQGVARARALVAGARVGDWYSRRRAVVAKGIGCTLVTRNVDGLHHAAGSRRVHELHGNIRRVKRFDRGHPADSWFDEMLREGALEHSQEAAGRSDAFLCVGTSGLVQTAGAILPLPA